MEYGLLSLLPITVFFTLIFTTRRMVMSFLAGLMTACIILSGTGCIGKMLEFIQASFLGGTTGYLFLLLALFGALIALLDQSGAALGFANWVSKFANTKKKTLILSYLVGLATFVDDYLHDMAMGSAMKPMTDRYRISRSKLAMITNGTSATICILIPMSTWGAFYAGLYESTGVCEAGKGLATYTASIPFMFYGIFMLLIILLVCLGLFPDLGSVKKQEKLVRETGVVLAASLANEQEEIVAKDAEETEGQPKNSNPLPFILSIVVIVAVTMINGDVLIGCVFAILMMVAICLISKKLNWNKMLDTCTAGVKSMFEVCFVIAVAIAFTAANTEIGMSDYLVGILTPILHSSAALFPAIVFVFLSIHGFFAGGAWTQSMIFMPVIVPIGLAIGANPLLIAGAVVSGSALSSTYYIGSDGVLLTAASTEVTPKGVMDSLVPYCLVAIVLSTIAYVVAGFVMI